MGFFSFFLSLGHHSRSHLFLDHQTLSHLFHPQSEWVTSHSPAQSGLYELITFSFHSPGKCLDVRTHQCQTECCFAFPPIWTTDWNALRRHSEVSAQLRMRQIKYLCFVTTELHQHLQMTKYAEREPYTVVHKQKISAAGKTEAQSSRSVLFSILPELLLPAYLLKVCAVCALIGRTACSSVM